MGGKFVSGAGRPIVLGCLVGLPWGVYPFSMCLLVFLDEGEQWRTCSVRLKYNGWWPCPCGMCWWLVVMVIVCWTLCSLRLEEMKQVVGVGAALKDNGVC